MKRTVGYESGQTLLELVVALGVVAVVLMGLVSAVTSSLRYGQASRFRSRSVKYAQEGIELARKLRDASTWDVFLSYSGTGTKNWCLSESGAWSADDGTGCPIAAGSPFWRSVAFVWNDPVVEVTSQTSWGEHTSSTTVALKTFFSAWR